MKKFTILILLIIKFKGTPATQVSCEIIGNSARFYDVGSRKTCFMENVTEIDSLGFTISSSEGEGIEKLSFFRNKKISFLPERIARTFPNLVHILAYRCSLKAVYKSNFQGLRQLKVLDLDGNRIERIASNTFDDLSSLEVLILSK